MLRRLKKAGVFFGQRLEHSSVTIRGLESQNVRRRAFRYALWLIAMGGVAIARVSHAEPALDAIAPAPVSLPENYSPPTRIEIESILHSPSPAHRMRVRPLRIVLCASEQDKGHAGPRQHNYPLWRERWSKLLALGEGLTVETADVWPIPAQWRRADIVVMNSDNGAWASEPKGSTRIAELGQDIDTFLARGGGLVFIHYALNAGANVEALANRLGLAWVGVPPYSKGRHDAAQWQLNKTHPLAAGLSQFRLPDESYWRMAGDLDASGARVLMSSPEEGAFHPQMWTRQIGRGRVFVSVPGHFTWTYDDPFYRILVFRGMMWSARQPLDRLAPLVPIGARFADEQL